MPIEPYEYNECPMPGCTEFMSAETRGNFGHFVTHFRRYHNKLTYEDVIALYELPTIHIGPSIHSFWVYVPEGTSSDEPTILLRVLSTAYGGPQSHIPLGDIGYCFYLLSGVSKTNFALDGVVLEIPEDLQDLTLQKFWYLTARGILVTLNFGSTLHRNAAPV